jgi:hypothetical protein
MLLCEVAEDLTRNISNDIKKISAFEFFLQQFYFIFLRMNLFETILMILYHPIHLVPTGTSPKLDIFEIQYNTIQADCAIRRPEDLPQKTLFRSKPNGRRNQGRPKTRWADGVNSDSLALGVREWTHCAQDRETWRDLLQQGLTRYWL